MDSKLGIIQFVSLLLYASANHQLWHNRVHKKFKQDELQFELKVKKENKLKFPSELSWSPRPTCLYRRVCSYDRTVCKVGAILPLCF